MHMQPDDVHRGTICKFQKKYRLGIGYINTTYSNKQVWTIATYNKKTEFHNLI